MNDGRRPFSASPYRVNCEITSTAPDASTRPTFIFPSASGNSLSPPIFSAIQSQTAGVSVCVKPTSRQKPRPMEPATSPSMLTDACDTR